MIGPTLLISVVAAFASSRGSLTQRSDDQLIKELSALSADWKRDGLLIGYPQGLHSSPSRYEFAVMAYSALEHMRVSLADSSPVFTPEFVRHFPSVAEACLELRAELNSMGASRCFIERKVSEVAKALHQKGLPVRFYDVPRGHWAENAVQELGKLGILKGYPDLRFRGK